MYVEIIVDNFTTVGGRNIRKGTVRQVSQQKAAELIKSKKAKEIKAEQVATVVAANKKKIEDALKEK